MIRYNQIAKFPSRILIIKMKHMNQDTNYIA